MCTMAHFVVAHWVWIVRIRFFLQRQQYFIITIVPEQWTWLPLYCGKALSLVLSGPMLLTYHKNVAPIRPVVWIWKIPNLGQIGELRSPTIPLLLLCTILESILPSISLLIRSGRARPLWSSLTAGVIGFSWAGLLLFNWIPIHMRSSGRCRPVKRVPASELAAVHLLIALLCLFYLYFLFVFCICLLQLSFVLAKK